MKVVQDTENRFELEDVDGDRISISRGTAVDGLFIEGNVVFRAGLDDDHLADFQRRILNYMNTGWLDQEG